MNARNDLAKISDNIIQKIYRCLFEAIGEDSQEAEGHLNLKTHISRPFLNWDLIYRNLIQVFSKSSVLYSAKKRGMWEVLLLYDTSSGMLLSFMKDNRFRTFYNAKNELPPQYVRALLTLNDDLVAKCKQQKLFTDEDVANNAEFQTLLNSLCINFDEPVLKSIKHHALIVFSPNYGQITSLKAYMLDKNFDIVEESDWLNRVKPAISNEIEKVSTEISKSPKPTLTEKAMRRIKQRELVELKSDVEKKDKKQ